MPIKLLYTSIVILLFIIGGLFFFLNKEEDGEFPRKSSHQVSVTSDYIVHATEDGFFPEKITIKKGETVQWVNDGTSYRWPASNLHPVHEIYSEFDPREPFAPGEAWSFTFTKSGLWRYHDHLKPNKLGTIIVE